MDFLHRSASPQPHARSNTTHSSGVPQMAADGGAVAVSSKEPMLQPSWLRIISVVLLFSLTVLVIGLVVLLSRSNGTNEEKFVDKTRYQAVFLSNNQVYFGKILDLNNKYVNMVDIYYLNTQKDSSSSNDQNSLALVKLGCEVHGPSDQLIVNRDQVTFWENVRTDSELAKGIKQWQDQHPNGQQCSTDNAQTSETNQQSPQQTANTEDSKQKTQ